MRICDSCLDAVKLQDAVVSNNAALVAECLSGGSARVIDTLG